MTGGYGILIAPQRLTVARYEVPITGLPNSLAGLRMVHITDTHYGPFTSLSYLEHVVRQANDLQGDLIVLTGDYVHRSAKAIGPGIGVFEHLQSRFGTLAVLGNHDHWEGTDACRRVFNRINVPLLDNKHLFLTSKGLSNTAISEASLCMAGVGDPWTEGSRIDHALANVGPAIPRIVLAHNPDSADQFDPAYRVDLVLAGHTHGGQVSLPFIGSPIQSTSRKYLGGVCQSPHCPVIVSRGAGLAGIPIRLGVPPEIGLLTLRSGDPDSEHRA